MMQRNAMDGRRMDGRPRGRRGRVLLAGLAAAAVLAAGGCASASSGSGTGQGTGQPTGQGTGSGSGQAAAPIVLHENAGAFNVTAKVGQKIEVILGSTYWIVKGSSKPGVVRQDGPTKPAPKPSSCATNIPGLGCVPLRTDFTAVAGGTAVITANRQSCGEALMCSASQRHFTLTVTVTG